MLADELTLIESQRIAINKPIIVHCRDAFDELLAIYERALDRRSLAGAPDEAASSR